MEDAMAIMDGLGVGTNNCTNIQYFSKFENIPSNCKVIVNCLLATFAAPYRPCVIPHDFCVA
jgi:hypothetical protein